MADGPAHRAPGRLRLLVAGAGVAGLEAVVALHALAPGRIETTLVDPGETFHMRALDTGEYFGVHRARRYPLAEIAWDLGAELVSEPLDRVDHPVRTAVVRSGRRIRYDALLLAVGARPYPALAHGVVFDPAGGDDTLTAFARRPAGHTAVVVPPGVEWTLPAYELALMLSTQPGATVTLVTAEHTPLAAFGEAGARTARDELATAGVALVTATSAVASSPTRLTSDGGYRLDVDRIVHLPRLVGPGIPGVPCDATGFILADRDGAIAGMDGAYAAGDGTAGTVKQGGLAARQGEAAALAIAARAGVELDRDLEPETLRSVLWTPRGPRHLRAALPPADTAPEVSHRPLWWPPTKVASAWLMPWLTTRDAHRPLREGAA